MLAKGVPALLKPILVTTGTGMKVVLPVNPAISYFAAFPPGEVSCTPVLVNIAARRHARS